MCLCIIMLRHPWHTRKSPVLAWLQCVVVKRIVWGPYWRTSTVWHRYQCICPREDWGVWAKPLNLEITVVTVVNATFLSAPAGQWIVANAGDFSHCMMIYITLVRYNESVRCWVDTLEKAVSHTAKLRDVSMPGSAAKAVGLAFDYCSTASAHSQHKP